MTAESTAICDQQTAEGRALGERSVWGARLTDGRCRREAGGRLCAVRADLPGLCQRHRRCVRPQIPGLSPGGLGPHLTSSGSPAGFPPVSRLPAGLFPFARRPLVSHRPAFSGSFPSAVAQVPVPPSVSPRVPFPLSNLHVSAAARQFCRRGSLAAGTKVTSSAATTSPGSRDPPALRMAATGHDGMPPQNRLICAGARAMPSRLGPRAEWRNCALYPARHGLCLGRPGLPLMAALRQSRARLRWPGGGMLSRFQSRRRTCSDRPGTVMRSPGLTTVRSWAAITGTAVSRTVVHSTP